MRYLLPDLFDRPNRMLVCRAAFSASIITFLFLMLPTLVQSQSCPELTAWYNPLTCSQQTTPLYVGNADSRYAGKVVHLYRQPDLTNPIATGTISLSSAPVPGKSVSAYFATFGPVVGDSYRAVLQSSVNVDASCSTDPNVVDCNPQAPTGCVASCPDLGVGYIHPTCNDPTSATITVQAYVDDVAGATDLTGYNIVLSSSSIPGFSPRTTSLQPSSATPPPGRKRYDAVFSGNLGAGTYLASFQVTPPGCSTPPSIVCTVTAPTGCPPTCPSGIAWSIPQSTIPCGQTSVTTNGSVSWSGTGTPSITASAGATLSNLNILSNSATFTLSTSQAGNHSINLSWTSPSNCVGSSSTWSVNNQTGCGPTCTATALFSASQNPTCPNLNNGILWFDVTGATAGTAVLRQHGTTFSRAATQVAGTISNLRFEIRDLPPGTGYHLVFTSSADPTCMATSPDAALQNPGCGPTCTNPNLTATPSCVGSLATVTGGFTILAGSSGVSLTSTAPDAPTINPTTANGSNYNFSYTTAHSGQQTLTLSWTEPGASTPCTGTVSVSVPTCGGPTCSIGTPTATPTDATCAGNDGRVSYVVANASGMSAELWSGNTLVQGPRTVPSTGNDFFQGLGPGTYTVRVYNPQDPTNCSRQSNAVTVNTNCITCTIGTPTATATNASCGASDGRVTYTYTNALNMWVALILNGNIVQGPVALSTASGSGSFSAVARGTYTVRVYNPNDLNCSRESAAVVVDENCVQCTIGTPTASATNATCNGNDGTVSFTVTNGAGMWAELMQNGVRVAGPLVVPSNGSGTFSNLGPNTYTVRVYNPNDAACSRESAAVVVGSNCTPCTISTPTLQGSNATCGQADGSITYTVTGATGMMAQLLRDGTAVGTPRQVPQSGTDVFTGLTPSVSSPSLSGLYSVRVYNPNDQTCARTSATTFLGEDCVSCQLTAKLSIRTDPSCENNGNAIIRVEISGSPTQPSVALHRNGSFHSNITVGLVSAGQWMGDATVGAGEYFVNVIQSPDCHQESNRVTVGDLQGQCCATVRFWDIVTEPDRPCEGGRTNEGTLTFRFENAEFVYVTRDVGGANESVYENRFPIGQDFGQISLTNLQSGTYFIEGHYRQGNPCSKFVFATIDEVGTPCCRIRNLTVTPNHPTCAGGATDGSISYSVTGAEADEFRLFKIVGGSEIPVATKSGNANRTGTFDNLAPGDYLLRVLDPTQPPGACQEEATVTLNDPNCCSIAQPSLTKVDPTCTALGSITYTVTNAAGMEVRLFKHNGSSYVLETGPLTVPQSGTGTFSGLMEGDYRVRVSDPNDGSCSAQRNITLDPPQSNLQVSITNHTDPTCSGNSQDGTIEVTLSGVTGPTTVDLYQSGSATPIATRSTSSDGSLTFSGLSDGSYYAQASMGGSCSGQSGNLQLDPPDCRYDLAIEKTALGTGPYEPGDQVLFTLTVSNQGLMPATGIRVMDRPGIGLRFVSSDAGTRANVVENAANDFTFNNLAPGASQSLIVTYEIDANFTGSEVENCVEITSDNGNDIDSDPSQGIGTDDLGDGQPDDDEACVQLPINEPEYDLEIDKLVIGGPYGPGDLVPFLITVTNSGDLPAANIEVTDFPSTGLSFRTSDANSRTNVTQSPVNPDIHYIILLAPGTSENIIVYYEIAAGYQGSTVDNCIEITQDDGDDVDSDPDQDRTRDDMGDGLPDDDEDCETFPVTQTYDLAIAKVLSGTGPFSPGDEVVFRITLSNEGTLRANNIRITDNPRPGLTYTRSNAGSLALVTEVAANVFEVSTIAAGATQDIMVTYTIDANFTGSEVENCVQITADDGNDVDSDPNEDYSTDDFADGQSDDDEACETVTLQSTYDLAIAKVLNSTGTVRAGDTIEFRITVTNEGNLPASNIEVTDYPDADLTYVESDASSNSNVTETAANRFTVLSLPVGQTEDILVRYRVNPGFQGSQVENCVEITADDGNDVDSDPSSDRNQDDLGDGQPDDDEACEQVTITPPCDLQVSAVKSDVSCFGDADGSIDVTVSGGTAPYTYSWSTSNGSGLVPNLEDQIGLSPGTYNLVVTDDNGCLAQHSETIGEPTELVVTLTDESVCAGQTTDLTPTVVGGTSPYSYLWNTSATTSTLMGVGPGPYSVVVTDDNGCSSSASAVVSETTGQIYTINGPDTICAQESVTFSVSPILTGATYSWTFSGSATPTTATGTSVQVTYASQGTSTIQVDVTGTACPGSADKTILINEAIHAEAGSDLSVCQGGSVQIDGSASIGTDYTWTIVSGDPTSIDGSNQSQVLNVSPLFTTVYRLTVKDATGICEKVDEVTVNVDVSLNPTAVAMVAESQYCAGQTVTLDGSSSQPPASDPNATLNYLWFVSPPVQANFVGLGQTFDVTPNTTTEYTLILSADGNGTTCSDTATVTVNIVDCNYDLAIEKSITSSGPYQPGGQVTFAIVVTNEGALDAADVQVTDNPASGLTFASSDAGSNANVTENAANIWTIASLASGASETINVTYDIDANFQGTTLLNQVQITADDGDDVDSDPDQDYSTDDKNDGNDDDDEDEVSVPIGQVYDLAIDKSITSSGPYQPGGQVTFAIVVTNEGSLDAADVQVTDNPASGLTFASSDAGSNTNVTENADNLWTIASLPSGASETINVTYDIDANFQGTTLLNQVQITADDGDDVDSDPDQDYSTDDKNDSNDDDDEDEVSIPVGQVYDLAIDKSITSSGPYQPGGQVTFAIVVTNEGSLDAADVEVTDNPASGLTFASSDAGSNANVTENADNIWTIASLPSGASETINVTYDIDANFQGTTLLNQVQITADDGDDVDSDPDQDYSTDDKNDSNDDDDEDEVSIPVGQVYDLAIDKSITSSGPYQPGGQVTFAIVVTNEGSLDAADVEVTDNPASGLTFASSDAGSNANVTENADNLWTIASLPSGASETINVTYDIDANFQGTTLLNQVQITADDGDDVDSDPDQDYSTDDKNDSNDDDDEDEVSIPVGQVYDLAIDKSITSSGPYQPGGQVTFAIVVTNEGSLDAADVEVTDNPASGLTFASSDAGSNTNVIENADNLWTIASLPSGASETINVTYDIDANFQGTTLLNQVQITADDGDDVDSDPDQDYSTDDKNDSNDDDDEDEVSIPVGQVYDLAIDKSITSSGPYQPGGQVTFAIVVTNEGSLDAADVEVTDNPASGLTFASSDAGSNANVTENADNLWTIASLPSGASETIKRHIRY